MTTAKTSAYPFWFILLPALIYGGLFLLPALLQFYFAFTRWDLSKAEWIGLDNFRQFFIEPQFTESLKHTLIYGFLTSGLKTVLGLLLAVYLTSRAFAQGLMRNVVFFPTLVSTIGVGFTFYAIMHPTKGLLNAALAVFGIDGPAWYADPTWALYTVAAVDVWKGVGLATLIYIAGIASISPEFYDAARIDGAGPWQRFSRITLPLLWPATVTVITLSLIAGLRSFDVIWAMTNGGPGYASDVLASIVYKNYQAGFYGLATAGNLMMFFIIALVALPLIIFLNSREFEQ